MELDELIKELEQERAQGRYRLTPVVKGKRITLYTNEADSKKITRGPGFKGIVTDIDTGDRYRVYGKSCSLPECYCDARAVKVV